MPSTQMMLAVAAWAAFTAVYALKARRRGNFNPVHTAVFSALVAAWFWFVTYKL